MVDRYNLLKRLERLEEEIAQLRAHVLASESMPKPIDPPPLHEEEKPILARRPPTVIPPPRPRVSQIAVAHEKEISVVAEQDNHAEKIEAPVQPVPVTIPANLYNDLSVSTDAEVRFGQQWAVRVGVILLLTGFIFLGNYAWEHFISGLGPLPRLLALLVLALGSAIGGEILRHKERLSLFGQVICAGGLAAIYYCAFAAHHIARLRVIEHPVIGSLLLVMTGLGILGYAAWRRSSILCCVALLMAFYGTCTQPIDTTAMLSALVVSICASILCLKNGWRAVGVTGVICCYLSYVIWQGSVYQAAAFSPASWYLLAYWLLFTVTILHPKAPWTHEQQVSIIAVNHTIFAALMSFDWQRNLWHENTWIFHAILGCVVFFLAFFLERKRGRNMLTEAHLLQAFTLMVLALVLRCPANTLGLSLAVKGLALMLWSRRDSRLVVECSAYGILLLAMIITANQITDLPAWRVLLPTSLIYFACLFIGRNEPDLRLLCRWAFAGFATFTFYRACSTMPGHIGVVCFAICALMFSLAQRIFGEKFPAPEARYAMVAASILSAVATCCIPYSNINPMLVVSSLVLILWHHALVSCTHKIEENLLHLRLSSASSLALGFWICAGGWVIQYIAPSMAHGTGSIIALLALWVLHGASRMIRGGDALQLLAPLFSIVVLITAGMDRQTEILIPSIGLLAYAAFLSHPRVNHGLYPVPLFLGFMMFTSRLWDSGLYAALSILAAAIVFYLPDFLRIHKPWKYACWAWLGLSFLHFTAQDPANQISTYASAVCYFVLLILRTRRWGCSSTNKSKIATLLLGSVVAIKLSLWAVQSSHHHGLTLVWAILAGCYFLLAFAMRERLMRLLMLLLLLCCMAKIVASVWELGTLMRILSFIVSGMVFIGLGYVYNRHPEWFGANDKKLVKDQEDPNQLNECRE